MSAIHEKAGWDFSPKDSYTREELLSCGHGQLFGPGNAKLPLPPMLMFDRITQITTEGGEYGKGELTAELDVHPGLWFLSAISKATLLCPGVLALTPCGNCLGFILAGRALRVRAVRSGWASLNLRGKCS